MLLCEGRRSLGGSVCVCVFLYVYLSECDCGANNKSNKCYVVRLMWLAFRRVDFLFWENEMEAQTKKAVW